MKNPVRFAILPLACLGLASAPARALRPAPQGGGQSACYSILSLPCIDCPGQRSKSCLPEPSGAFQSCSETTSSCGPGLHCSQVLVDTGPACGN